MSHGNARLSLFGRKLLVERVAAGHKPGEVAKQLVLCRRPAADQSAARRRRDPRGSRRWADRRSGASLGTGAQEVPPLDQGAPDALAGALESGMISTVGVHRVVPDLSSQSLETAKAFYGEVLGLEPVMDHGWITTLADPARPGAQISLMTHDDTAPVIPDVSIEVDDVDACHAAAVRTGAEIVHPLSDEPWGVRRFFVRDPDGHVINVLSHP